MKIINHQFIISGQYFLNRV